MQLYNNKNTNYLVHLSLQIAPIVDFTTEIITFFTFIVNDCVKNSIYNRNGYSSQRPNVKRYKRQYIDLVKNIRYIQNIRIVCKVKQSA